MICRYLGRCRSVQHRPCNRSADYVEARRQQVTLDLRQVGIIVLFRMTDVVFVDMVVVQHRTGPIAGEMLALMLKRTTNLVYLSLANNRCAIGWQSSCQKGCQLALMLTRMHVAVATCNTSVLVQLQ